MFWRFDECSDQRDARRFNEWIVPGAKPEEWPKFHPFQLGYKATQRTWLPEDTPLETWIVRPSGPMPLPDLWCEASHWAGQANHFILSRRLRDALRLPPMAAQFRPIELIAEDPAAREKGYCLMRLLASAATMDRERSAFTVVREASPEGFEGAAHREEHLDVREFVLKPDIAPPADLFWSEEEPRVVLITDAAAERVQAAACSGVTFDRYYGGPSWSPASGHRIRRKPGGGQMSVPDMRGVIGIRPARRPQDRPPLVPTPRLPPELAALEATVGHRLPRDYIEFFVSILASGPLEPTSYDGRLIMEPRWVLEENESVRCAGGSEWLREGAGWPADWLVIGDDGFGNYWVLDLGCDPSPVIHYDHDYGDARVVAANLDAYRTLLAERSN